MNSGSELAQWLRIEWQRELDDINIISDGGRASDGWRGDPVEPDTYQNLHVARFNPQRMADETEAKLRILDVYQRLTGDSSPLPAVAQAMARKLFENALRVLAVPLADRPGYREEWRP